MIQNEKIKLLGVWESNIFSELSISEIMAISKKKTKPWVFNALKLLTRHKLLVARKKGNLNLYKLNLDNPLLLQALQYLDVQNNLDFSKLDVIIDAISRIPVKNYCLVVFGSYAENKQKASSDLDICFLVESKQVEKKIKPYLNEVKLEHTVSIDEHCITFEDFVQMLLRGEENLGKQIFRNHKLFFNAEIYYQLIKEAHKNGFGQ